MCTSATPIVPTYWVRARSPQPYSSGARLLFSAWDIGEKAQTPGRSRLIGEDCIGHGWLTGTPSRLDDINKHCLTEFRKHWECLENNNQQLWQCRRVERPLNKCVFDNLVCDTCLSSSLDPCNFSYLLILLPCNLVPPPPNRTRLLSWAVACIARAVFIHPVVQQRTQPCNQHPTASTLATSF